MKTVAVELSETQLSNIVAALRYFYDHDTGSCRDLPREAYLVGGPLLDSHECRWLAIALTSVATDFHKFCGSQSTVSLGEDCL